MIHLAYADMSDDFNAPKALARLFELVTKVNGIKAGHLEFGQLTTATLEKLKATFTTFIFDIFGLKDDTVTSGGSGEYETLDGLMQMVIKIRQSSRENKDWATADTIRDTLKALKIQLKDGKEGTAWSKE